METRVVREGRARGRAELPLEGKADADPAETRGAASSTFALVALDLSHSKSLEQARQAGVLHACLEFSLSIISITD